MRPLNRLFSALRSASSCCVLTALGLLSTAFAGAEARAENLSLQQQVVLLDEAQRAFDEGAALRQTNPTQAGKSFGEAAMKFQGLVDSGLRNGKLYYNLGNSYLESGQIGRAVLNYRRAQEFIPDDPRLEANLRYARSLRRNQIAESGEQAFLRTLFFWHYDISLHGRFVAAGVVYVLFWVLLTASLFLPRLRWRYAVVPVAAVCLSLGLSVAASMSARNTHRGGVILSDHVIVRKGNGEGFEPQFKEELYEGVEFDLVERRADWLCIRLPDGKIGWIRSRDAEMI